MNTVTIISLIIGLVGLLATIIGTYLTYISFVNPLIRIKRFLKNPEKWEKFEGINDKQYLYRYKKYPNFQIVIDWDKEIVEGFQEEWINDVLYPDKTNNASYFVKLEVNGMLLDKEVFVTLDGHRYFVPVPRVKSFEGKRKFYYDLKQVQLANIIGRYHLDDEDIYGFAKNQINLTVVID